MSTTHSENASYEVLLKDVQRLTPLELEQFTFKVIELRAQQKTSHLSENESELLLKINQGIPQSLLIQYNVLLEKRKNETLMEEEYQNLLSLTEKIENLEVKRIEYLSNLASIRGVSLSILMEDLGIQSPTDT